MILIIKTDNPEAEVGLYEEGKQLAYESWQAHRELSVTIHKKIEELLTTIGKNWEDITGIVCFKGPGSFTGLRIGLTVGNALSNSLNIPIISTEGKEWMTDGLRRLEAGENEHISLPEYGRDARITLPKK